jgi:hypothetical protein
VTSAVGPGISQRVAAAAHKALDGHWCFQLAGGAVRIVRAALPGRAMVNITRTAGALWVVLDDRDLRAASEHLCQLLLTWPADVGRDPVLDAVGELFCEAHTPEPRCLIRQGPVLGGVVRLG